MLLRAIADHEETERRFTAALHGVALQDRHGVARGRRQDAMRRMKQRRGGH